MADSITYVEKFELFGEAWHVRDAEACHPGAITATLTADGWEGEEAPYTQTVSAEGITADTNGMCGLTQDAINDDDVYSAVVAAALVVAGQEENSVTIKAMGTVPSVDIPIVIVALEGGE